MASIWTELLSAVLLFSLVFGMSATVEIAHMRKQAHNSTALLIGVSLQFIILPLVGFLTVQLLSLPAEVGITLLVITSSPGGSYSNWWCSMFNADLALSVTMTAVSTLLSTLMLPANLVLYTKFTYSAAVVKTLDWRALFISLTVVIGGICSGLVASHRANSSGNAVSMRRSANRMGNFAGLALILLSVSVSSSNQKAALWDQDTSFYAACIFPPILGLIMAVSLATYFELDKPERVSVSIESCYQNTGIATTVALTMFKTEAELATAIGVPLLYGIVEGAVILIFCLVCWKCGWTKAPANANLCTVIATSYEVESSLQEDQEPTAIEVVLSHHEIGGSKQKHMIFSRTDAGTCIVDEETLHDILHNDSTEKQMSCPEAEDPTECSESDHIDDCEENDDALLDDGQRRGNRWRPYRSLDTPDAHAPTDVSLSALDVLNEGLACIDEAMNSRTPTRIERRTLSEIRTRAKNLASKSYVRPAILPSTSSLEDQSFAQSQDHQSTANAVVFAVSKAAATVSKRNPRRNYEIVCTKGSPTKTSEPAATVNAPRTASDSDFDDCLL
jgi:predicted Na+-dependent transporter